MWQFALLGCVSAIQLTVTDTSNVKSVASTMAYDMMTTYQGNQTGQIPGLLPGGMACNPNQEGIYCWWEAGAMFGSLINYWQYTGDTSYNEVVSEAMAWQRGAEDDFNPANQSRGMGLDDQAFWSFTALDAVESNFPEAGGDCPSWLSLAQAVFNFQADLWDEQTCGGGFRWQVYPTNKGYNLKNAVSNGGNFMLAARLAYITGNQTYADWATKVFTWIDQSQLYERITQGSTTTLYIWDNTNTDNNCTDQTNHIWTYNYGIMLGGAAYMYNLTNGDPDWLGRVNEILESTFTLFFPSQYGGNIMQEMQCETQLNCNMDQKSFKAYLARWMAVTALLVPSTAPLINPKLQASAVAAAGQCDGGQSGRQCGMQWFTTTWDGTYGVGQQMAAMSVVGSTLATSNMAPLTLRTGATSKSDPNAGNDDETSTAKPLRPITGGDRAGAAIFTIILIGIILSGVIFVVLPD